MLAGLLLLTRHNPLGVFVLNLVSLLVKCPCVATGTNHLTTYNHTSRIYANKSHVTI
jgi:hypothetical protein